MVDTPLANGSEKLRDAEVLATAARVFHDRGYASSSVQVIADELGILKGSLYYYTKSKEELLYRIIQTVYDDLQVILDEVQASSLPPLEKLREYVYRQARYATENITGIAIYYRDADQLSAERRDSITESRRRHQRFVRELIVEGQAGGVIVAEEDPVVLADLIFGSFIWTYRWFDPAGKRSSEAVARAAADFAVRAVRV